MMTREEAIDFGRFSAVTALDQISEWGTLQNSIDTYRDNLRDTLNEHRASQHEPEAFAAFDAYIRANKQNRMTPETAITALRRQAQSAKRVAALRAKRAALGLKRIELYVHPEDRAQIVELATKLNRQRTAGRQS